MQIVKQQTYSKCKFLFNDKEWNNCKLTGTQDFFGGDYLIKVIKPSRKTRAKAILFDKGDYVKSLNKTQTEIGSVEVIPFFQFPEGYKISNGNHKLILDIQLDSNVKSVVFMEKERKQSFDKFKIDIQSFLLDPRLENKKPFIFLDPRSKHIREKIEFALNSGIREFIFRGGKYKNLKFWVGIIAKIHLEKGNVFISIPKRYDNDTKISYAKPLIDFGADYVFHQAFQQPPLDQLKQNILYLGNGFKYFKNLNQDNVKNYLEKSFTKVLDKTITDNKGKEYALSRVISINTAPNLIKVVVIYEILDTL